MSIFSNFDGIICLPGTHTKWVHVSAGEVISFRTFMSGELFDLVSRYSVLKHSVKSDDWNDKEFKSAVSESISNPQKIFSDFFKLRADHLLKQVEQSELRSKLSGYIIGAELAGAKPYWLGQNVVILGNDNLSKIYKKFKGKKKIIGICLGFQHILYCEGAKIIEQKKIYHGFQSNIKVVNNKSLFQKGKIFKVGRYHSLKLKEPFKSNNFEITMRCLTSKVAMAFENNKEKIYGFQFHPESFLTINGNFLIKKILSS